MFPKIFNLALIGTLACALSACGGGVPDDAAMSSPTNFSAAVAAQPVAASPALTSAPVAEAVAAAPAVQAADPLNAAHAPAHNEIHVAVMHGGGAQAVGDRTTQQAALEARQAAQAEAERDRVAASETEDEKWNKMLRHHNFAQYQPRIAAAPGARRPLPGDADCVDPRGLLCSGN